MRRIFRTCLTTLAALGALAPAAHAAAPYSSPYFNPNVSVTVSNAQAGAHPDVSIRMTRPANRCQPPILYEESGIKPYQLCDISYVEQNLREWVMRLPQGLMADLNATPVSCKEPERKGLEIEYWCPPESKVGELTVRDRECYVDYMPFGEDLVDVCFTQDDLEGLGQQPSAWGEVFMGEPKPGEQARLYVLAGMARCYREGGERRCDYSRYVRIDASVRLDTSGEWRIVSTSVDIPDTVLATATAPPLPVSIYEATITLFGDTGVDSGHPLINNPTSCHTRALDSTLTGYAINSHYPEGSGVGVPGEGWGSTVDDAAHYPIVGCNSLPYDPGLSVDLGTPIPASPTGLTAVLTQERGEQTTDKVQVDVPRSFRVNFDNRLEQCSADQAANRACPAGSKVGEIEAESTLLPETGDLAGPLRGEVFVGETTADHIRLYTILHGFVEATIEGRLEMLADGASRTVFDLPEVPQQRIVLTLYGGENKALITAPKSCGTHVLEATFTSHQGTQARRQVPVEVSCTGASFDVEVGTRRPRAHPTVLLTASSPDMRAVAFDLSRYLKVGRSRRTDAGSQVGSLTVTGDEGTRDLKVKLARQGRLGSLALSATEGGAQATTLGAYDATLSTRAKRRLSARRGKRHSKGPTRLWVRDLPAGTTKVSLELTGSRGSLIQNPERCRVRGKRLRLGFAAHLGQRHGKNATLQRSVLLGCKKNARRTRRR